MKKKHKVLALVLSGVILVTGAILGAIAYLTHQTPEKENVFVVGDINLTLTESDDLDLTLIPDTKVKKDPVLTVESDSVDCFLFVKIDKTENFDEFAEYSIASGWTKYSGTADPGNLYYREVSAATTDQSFPILANNQVNVKDFTKATVEMYGSTQPKLTFTGFAVQKDSIDAAEVAWATIYSEYYE